MHVFILQSTIICVLLALAFLAAGVANAIYASENGDLHGDLCSGGTIDDELCNHLEPIIGAQAASAVS